MTSRFVAEVRRRLLPHAIFFFAVWPVVSALCAAISLKEQVLTWATPWGAVTAGVSAATLRMTPEFAAVGVCFLPFSVVLFAALELGRGRPAAPSRTRRFAEPFVLFLALFSGAALEYPALLRHPLAAPVRPLPVWLAMSLVTAMLLLLAAFVARGWARRDMAALLAATVCAVSSGWGLTHLPDGGRAERAAPGSIVLLGIDSLSQKDDVSILRDMTRRLGGAWYERPVTPGLLTNSVWPALLMHRTVQETGVVFVYQAVDWSRSSFHLVRAASARGCRTVSFFSDQFTTYVGSDGGFDRDRSGPKGWLQIATAGVKDASVFLPILLPHFPAIPGATTPANQSGTFAFDIGRELREILTGGGSPCTFIAGHLDYLHQALYPRFSDLTPSERAAVRSAPVETLQDLSLDWQFPNMPGEPFPLYRWKIRHVQALLERELRRTEYLEPEKNNRLVLFSDHGNRRAVALENFGKPQYQRVVLATFGVAGRDAARPISILDVSELLGFADPARPGPSDPVVEYTSVVGQEWNDLMLSARLRPDGEVLLEESTLKRIAGRLKGYRPYSGSEVYFPTPADAAIREPGDSRSPRGH